MSLATIRPERAPREPLRFKVAKVAEQPSELSRLPACEPVVVDDYDLSAPARAVLEARSGTCRYPFGERETFRFCGARATVGAAGVLTYCGACAGLMRKAKLVEASPSAASLLVPSCKGFPLSPQAQDSPR